MREAAVKIGQRIKLARHAARLSQRELGRRIGVSGAMICKYELGQTMPSLAKLQQISAHTDMPVEFFLRPKTIPSLAVIHAYKGK